MSTSCLSSPPTRLAPLLFGPYVAVTKLQLRRLNQNVERFIFQANFPGCENYGPWF